MVFHRLVFVKALTISFRLVRRRRGQRVHPGNARPAVDPGGQTRSGARGGERVHRRFERSRRLRVGGDGAADRDGGIGRARGDRHADGGRAVVGPIPRPPPSRSLPGGCLNAPMLRQWDWSRDTRRW